jgi:hypothetical protein
MYSVASGVGSIPRVFTVAHKMWAAAWKPDRIKVWDVKTVGSLKIETHTVTATELHQWAEDFRGFSAQVDAFMKARGRSLPPEPGGFRSDLSARIHRMVQQLTALSWRFR